MKESNIDCISKTQSHDNTTQNGNDIKGNIISVAHCQFWCAAWVKITQLTRNCNQCTVIAKTGKACMHPQILNFVGFHTTFIQR